MVLGLEDLTEKSHASVHLLPPVREKRKCWALVNGITLEQLPLPKPVGAWKLVRDDDGWAALVDTASDQHLLVEKLLKRTLFTDTNGERYIRTRSIAGEHVYTSLWEKQMEYRKVYRVVHVGPTFAKHELEGCYLNWPRHANFHIVWKLVEFYKILALSTYSGKPSKWVGTLCDQWNEQCNSFGFSHHVVRSQACRADMDRGLEADGFLDDTSMTTLALLQSLARWGTRTPNDGGLRGNDPRAAALCFFAGVLTSAFSKTTFSLPIAFVEGWIPQWPADELPGHLELEVCKGQVSLQTWKQYLESGPEGRSIAEAWWAHFNLGTLGNSLSIDQFLIRLFRVFRPPEGSHVLSRHSTTPPGRWRR